MAISTGPPGATPMATVTHTAAKLPYIHTSEWAKLISCSTPYTRV
jgi:hypothetical protein